MIDPLSLATGTVTGQVAAILWEQIQKYFKADTTDRLFRLLDERFGERTGLTVSQLETWREDETFRVALSSSAGASGASTGPCSATPSWRR